MDAAADLLPTLKTVFGFDEFRGQQAAVVDRVMAGRGTLAIMPTGAGKSLTYQLPAVARAAVSGAATSAEYSRTSRPCPST